MTKADFINSIFDELRGDASKAVIGKVLEALVSVGTQVLKKGEAVPLTGLGSFKTVQRQARKGRNPRTGDIIDIPARIAVNFSCSKTLKDALK